MRIILRSPIAQRGQVLFDGRLGQVLEELLDEGRDVNRLYPRKTCSPWPSHHPENRHADL
jgi:hypothetical protein